LCVAPGNALRFATAAPLSPFAHWGDHLTPSGPVKIDPLDQGINLYRAGWGQRQ
jgi:hypothetical protein